MLIAAGVLVSHGCWLVATEVQSVGSDGSTVRLSGARW